MATETRLVIEALGPWVETVRGGFRYHRAVSVTAYNTHTVTRFRCGNTSTLVRIVDSETVAADPDRICPGCTPRDVLGG